MDIGAKEFFVGDGTCKDIVKQAMEGVDQVLETGEIVCYSGNGNVLEWLLLLISAVYKVIMLLPLRKICVILKVINSGFFTSGGTSLSLKKKEGAIFMKQEYETPKAEKMEFDYSDVVTASDKGNCMIIGMGTSWTDAAGNTYSNSTAGD